MAVPRLVSWLLLTPVKRTFSCYFWTRHLPWCLAALGYGLPSFPLPSEPLQRIAPEANEPLHRPCYVPSSLPPPLPCCRNALSPMLPSMLPPITCMLSLWGLVPSEQLMCSNSYEAMGAGAIASHTRLHSRMSRMRQSRRVGLILLGHCCSS